MNNSLEGRTHLVLKGITNLGLELLLGFFLLVENTKGDVFEVADRGDLFVEKNLLSYYIDKELPCFLVHHVKALVVFVEHAVNLSCLKLFDGVNKFHWAERLVFNLLNYFAIALVRWLLEVTTF